MDYILVDTREQKNSFIEEELGRKYGMAYERTKLMCGDYMLMSNPFLSIDRKANIQEVVGNVTQQHYRFREECLRAKRLGIKLIILIQDERIKTLEDLDGWINPRRRRFPKATSGKQLRKILETMQERYNVEFRFCNKRKYTGTLLSLLGVEHDSF